MPSRLLLRSLPRRRNAIPTGAYRCFSGSVRTWQDAGKTSESPRMTEFGYETVPVEEKQARGEYKIT